MAIKSMSSRQLMGIMDNAEDQMSEIRSTMNNMRDELDKRLSVFGNAMEYASNTIGKFNEYLLQREDSGTSTAVLASMDAMEGSYSKYGISVFPSSISEPMNVFNFMAATGPIFKNNANVYINDTSRPDYAAMLAHDAVKGKGTSFAEYERQAFTLKVSVNPNDLLGATTCNTLEILPYIPGSFDIKGIRFYTMQDYRNQSTVPSMAINGTIPNVGACRMLIGKTIDLYSCEIDINVNFRNSAGKYPFGLRHLYFLNANYNPNSYIVVKLSRDSYIDWVSDDIVVHDQSGVRVTTCTEEGIKLYAEYISGILSSEIVPTKGIIQTSLARNTRDIYLNIPVKKSIFSVKFKEIGLR